MTELTTPPQVLLIEDNPDDVTLAIRALKASGVTGPVEVAEDGVAALAKLLGEGEAIPPLPSLVLLDLQLPKISGLEVLKQIRAHPRTHEVPVVVLTSSDDHGDLARSYRLGANSYIRKNADPSKFGESIQRLVDYWLDVNPNPSLLMLT